MDNIDPTLIIARLKKARKNEFDLLTVRVLSGRSDPDAVRTAEDLNAALTLVIEYFENTLDTN